MTKCEKCKEKVKQAGYRHSQPGATEARMNAFEERILGGMTPMEACLDLVPDGTITDAMEECKRLAREAVLKAHPEYTDATTMNTRDEKNNYICRWRYRCMLSGEEAPDFKKMIEEMLDDTVYEEGGKLPHLLCISKLEDNGFTQQKYFTPPIEK